MRLAYFDSSAIVKLERLESESLALVEYLDSNDVEASTSMVARIEVVRALRRALPSPPSDPLRGFFLLNLDEAICAMAERLESPTLRSLDAIHLATALAIDDEVEFITYDERLAAAAREHRLRVVQPGRA